MNLPGIWGKFIRLSGIYELALDVASDNAWMFLGLVFTADSPVERLLRRFCSGWLPEFQLHCPFDDFSCIHRLFGDAENFHGGIQQ